MLGRHCAATVLVVCVLGGGVSARAELSPNGGEFQVNTYSTQSQSRAAVATDIVGNFVVVWVSDGSGGTDTGSRSIQAQRFAADGAALGAQFQVNAYSTAFQGYPAVAMDDLGRFVVVWESEGSSGSDTGSRSIQAQRFDSDGSLAGGEIQVNSYTTGAQFLPAVVSGHQGGFIVVWNSVGSSGTDASAASIQAQRFDATGNALGTQFQVNSYTTGPQYSPAVGMDGEGAFVIAWHSFGSGGTDTDESSVQAQRYDASGVVSGQQFQVNTYTTSGQFAPAVGVAETGQFVVVWGSSGSSGTDTSYSSSQAQRFAADGAALGAQFQVNTYTPGYQHDVSLAMNGRGELVVTWGSLGSSGTDTESFSIQAERRDANGAALEGEFQVNSYTTSMQGGSAVAIDGKGNFVIVWESFGSTGTDTSLSSIQAQRYDGLFHDDLETGGSSRWTATVP